MLNDAPRPARPQGAAVAGVGDEGSRLLRASRTSGSRTSRSPTVGDDEVVVRSRPAASAARTSSTTTARARSARPTARARSSSATSSCGEVVEAGKLAASYGLAEGDRVAVNPDPELQRLRLLPRSGKVAFCPNMSVLGVTTNGGFAEYAKTKIAHAYKLPDSLTDEQGAFVEMLSSAAVRGREARRDRAGQPRGRLRPGPGRPLDGAAAEERGRARRARRHARLPARASAKRSAPTTSGTRGRRRRRTGRRISPQAIQEVNGGRARGPRARRDGQRRREPAGDRDHRPGLDGRAAWASPGPNDAVSLPMLSNLTQDKTIRFSWLYPLQWPNDDPAAATTRRSTPARSSRTRRRWTGSAPRSSASSSARTRSSRR